MEYYAGTKRKSNTTKITFERTAINYYKRKKANSEKRIKFWCENESMYQNITKCFIKIIAMDYQWCKPHSFSHQVNSNENALHYL